MPPGISYPGQRTKIKSHIPLMHKSLQRPSAPVLTPQAEPEFSQALRARGIKLTTRVMITVTSGSLGPRPLPAHSELLGPPSLHSQGSPRVPSTHLPLCTPLDTLQIVPEADPMWPLLMELAAPFCAAHLTHLPPAQAPHHLPLC